MTDTALEAILLIDDNQEDFEATRRAFKKIGLKNPLVYMSSGDEALHYLKSADNAKPALILLDLNMPGMGGHDVLKILKQDNALKEIPVVMLTSMKSKLAIKTCYQLGANAYVHKSADFGVLAENIKRLKEHWLDMVELPQVFDEDAPHEKAVFSILEGGNAPETMQNHAANVYLSPEEVYTKIMGPGAAPVPQGSVKLSPQEIETLTWVARGKSRWEVSKILNVSEDTIKSRLEKTRQKLNASNTTHAIAMALLHGFLLPAK